MGVLVQLAASTLAVDPGRSATTEVTVRNTGSVVDRFTFEALGPAAEWVKFEPSTLSLFPEASGTVSVTVAPPRTSAVAAGEVPFGVRAVSAEDPEGSAADEGTLEVAPFTNVSVELLPRVVYARRSGMGRLVVDNRSNVPYEGQLAGADAANALRFAFHPAVVSVPPGGAEFVRIRIRPVKVFWRGPSSNKPFQVALNSDMAPHPPRLDADGSVLQEAVLPKWVIWLLAGLVALAAIAALLWFTLLKPQIRSTASDEVKSQLASTGLPTSQSSGGAPKSGGGGGGGGGSTTPTTAGTSTAVAPTGTGSAGLTVNGSGVANGNGDQTIYTVPSGYSLQVTDLLIQNAAGDTGTLALGRNGSSLMEWAMANFRDLDYHWVSPTLFTSGSKVVMSVSGCSGACHPAIYYAGTLVKSS